MSFKKYLREITEDTSSADIATVDNKLKMINHKDKHLVKGKKCKAHKRLNCQNCYNDKWRNDE